MRKAFILIELIFVMVIITILGLIIISKLTETIEGPSINTSEKTEKQKTIEKHSGVSTYQGEKW